MSDKVRKLIYTNDFYSDISAPEAVSPDMLYAAIIRSPVAYGYIVSIEFPRDEEIPKDYSIFTYRDIPKKNVITTINTKTKVFSEGEIAYKGEPIGILVGPDETEVKRLLTKLVIRFDKSRINEIMRGFNSTCKKSLFSLETSDKQVCFSAFSDKSPEPIQLIENNFIQKPLQKIAQKEIFSELGSDKEQFDKIFSTADFVVQDVWQNQLQPLSSKETNGALVYVNANCLHVFTPNEWISHLRKALSDVTGFSSDEIIITRTNVSSQNTNSLWQNATIAAQAAVAAIKTGKPVKIMLSRAEQEEFIENIAPVTIKHRTAVNKDGTILAMNIEIEVEAGAVNPFAKELLNRLVIASQGIYSPKQYRITAVAYSAHTPPTSVNLPTIDVQAFFAVENQIQKISYITGLSARAIRLANFKNMNLSQKKEAEATSENDTPRLLFDLGRVSDVFNAVCNDLNPHIRIKRNDITKDTITKTQEIVEEGFAPSRFDRKYAVYRATSLKTNYKSANSPYSPPLRGIGFSCSFEGTGFFGSELLKNSISIETTLREYGKLVIHTTPPSDSVWTLWLNIAEEILGIDRKQVFIDCIFDEDEEPEYPESINSNIGIKTYLFRKSCESIKRKKNEPLPITVRKSIPESQISLWNKKNFEGKPFYSTSFCACTVETELEPCTMKVKILEINIVIDCGKILNVKATESTLKLEAEEILAQVIEKDKLHCSNINIMFIQSDDEPKQIGSILYSALPAALSSALAQALGKPLNHLPIQSDTILELNEAMEEESNLNEIQEEPEEYTETEAEQ